MQQAELTLDDMLSDPIVRQLMDRDGVPETALRDLAARFRSRSLGDGPAFHRREPEPRSFEG
jgi:hypothetical protein